MAGQQDRLMDETMNHMRFIATVQKRSAPPRCHPISICITIQGFGLVFIGLTMTLIANWPGATSVGTNPLKIAGPVLLGLGALVCVIGLILVRTLRKKAVKKWDQKVTHMAKAASKQILNQSETSFARAEIPTDSKTKPKAGISTSQDFRPIEESRYLLSPEIHSPGNPTDAFTFETTGNTGLDEENSIPEAVRARKQRRKELAASSQEDLTEDEAMSDADRQARRERRRQRKLQKELLKQQQQEEEANPKVAETKPEIPGKPKPPTVKPKPKIPGGESPQLRLHVRPAPGTTVVVHSGRQTPPQPKSRSLNRSIESDI